MHETFPRDIVIVDAVAPDLRPVMGDATQLHQVLMNLCVNSRDAMPAGGRMTIFAENTVLSAADVQGHAPAVPGRYTLLTVEDTGQGIPPKIIERIFDPFFTTKEVGKGTGLGLSTVLGIVKNHKGFITVRSELNKGTTFKVYLPSESGEAMEGSRTPMLISRGRKEFILVVDDEEHIRKSTQLLLESNNYGVVVAANGREALARLLENQDAVKLVLTDIMMPVMNGADLARALRGIKPGIKIIATTGLDHHSKQADFATLGVKDILSKPCDPAELLSIVRRVLDSVAP